MTAMDFAFAVWETFYITVLSTAFALVLGLPLGVLLVAGDKDGVLPLPGWLMHALNFVINILRSIPFLILMICVFPLSRLIVGTTVGTNATIVPLVAAACPFVARRVETTQRALDAGVCEPFWAIRPCRAPSAAAAWAKWPSPTATTATRQASCWWLSCC